LRWANAGGGYPYDSTFVNDANVAGYPKGARVLRSDGTGYWLSTTDGNVTDPESSGSAAAGWLADFTTGAALVTMTSSNVTLTASQYGKPIIIISGALTANLNLIFPTVVSEWAVINNTSGAFTITGKTIAGTGVLINAGLILIGDGTNIVQFLATTTAALTSNTPAGNITATKVQAALNEIDVKKVSIAGAETIIGAKTMTGANAFNGTLGATSPTTVSATTGTFSNNLSFNSGYGSSAVAYGCRAWVNFNGTGSATIRASGNVSSVTSNFTGDYTVNFINSMPDVNFSASVTGISSSNNNATLRTYAFGNYGVGSIRVRSADNGNGVAVDANTCFVAIFR
jgi:hypothetical protein